MITEMTNKIDGTKGWVLYDGTCGMCSVGMRKMGRLLARLGYAAAPLQEKWVAERIGSGTGRDEMLLLTRDGRVKGGVDVYLHVADEVWWGKPVVWAAKAPGLKRIFDGAYWALARNRTRISQACWLDGPSARAGSACHEERKTWVENPCHVESWAGSPCHGVFVADWTNALFVHFKVEAAELRKVLPAGLEVDTFGGEAYVSVVAFGQERLRPIVGGKLGEWLSRPVGSHEFLNLRTYVRRGNDRGIYFIAEWIPNRLAAWLGPRLYGLPYRLGKLNYGDEGGIRREVTCDGGRLECRAKEVGEGKRCERGSLGEFLLERYMAFTCRNGVVRRFRIAHEPWVTKEVTVERLVNELPVKIGMGDVAGAHYSNGVKDVKIGKAERVTPRRGDVGPWLALIVPAAVVGMLWNELPAWAWMWAMALALFLGCKVLTFHRALRKVQTSAGRALAYLLAWPGMDAVTFLDGRKSAPLRVAAKQGWLRGAVNSAVGAALVWGVVRRCAPLPLLAGWIGMIGLVLLLHFGLFDLMGWAWRRSGVDAEPLMDRPASATSLREFWGGRWNAGFHRLAADLLFRPTRRLLDGTGAMLATFLMSGIVHELVITVPARGGYGGPTVYFMIQGAGVALERRLGLRKGVVGWLFTAVCTVAPIGLLFPAVFVERVVIPFLHVIGAY